MTDVPPMKRHTPPLHFATFRALWIATIVSNVGTWMHSVGAQWLMTSLSPSPLMVALVQATTTLPMFLLALPAGALADIIDRRKMLLAAQLLSGIAAAGLAITTWYGLTTPPVLLVATLVLGTAAALSDPVFQAIVPELVDWERLGLLRHGSPPAHRPAWSLAAPHGSVRCDDGRGDSSPSVFWKCSCRPRSRAVYHPALVRLQPDRPPGRLTEARRG